MNTPDLPAWTVVGLYPDYRDYDRVLAAACVAHGYGRTAREGQQDTLSRVVAGEPDHLSDPDTFDEDCDRRDGLIILAVFPGHLFDRRNRHEVADTFALQPHATAELEGLAAAAQDAEAAFLGQCEVTACPHCGEETALVTPAGRVVCACWTNPAQEIVDELPQARVPDWVFFHEKNLPGDWPEELDIHLRKGGSDVEVRVIPYPDSLSIEFLDPEGTPYEAEITMAVAENGRLQIWVQNDDERISIATDGDYR